MLQKYVRCTFLILRNAQHYQNKTCRCISTCNSFLGDQQGIFNDPSSQLKRTVPLTSAEFKNLKIMTPSQPENPHLLKVSIIGEPNVGKSTLTNRLVKWRVCAVSSKVHTTRRKARAVLVEGDTQIAAENELVKIKQMRLQLDNSYITIKDKKQSFVTMSKIIHNLVFLDTPGFVTPEKTKRHSLEPSFVMDPMKSVREADLLAVVVDISDKWTNNRINTEILRLLYDFKEKKSILVLNKIDAMKSKSRLLSLTRILTSSEISPNKKDSDEDKEVSETKLFTEICDNFSSVEDVDPNFYENIEHKRGWPLFSKVFMVSALKDDGIEDLRNYLLNEALPRDWTFHEGLVTDQHPHEIALMTVRENLLEYLPNEIPYKLNLKITKWEMLSTGCPKIDIEIMCPNSRHRFAKFLQGSVAKKSFVIGPDGKHIAALVAKCKKAMRESFRIDVVLKITVK